VSNFSLQSDITGFPYLERNTSSNLQVMLQQKLMPDSFSKLYQVSLQQLSCLATHASCLAQFISEFALELGC